MPFHSYREQVGHTASGRGFCSLVRSVYHLHGDRRPSLSFSFAGGTAAHFSLRVVAVQKNPSSRLQAMENTIEITVGACLRLDSNLLPEQITAAIARELWMFNLLTQMGRSCLLIWITEQRRIIARVRSLGRYFEQQDRCCVERQARQVRCRVPKRQQFRRAAPTSSGEQYNA